MYRDISYLQFKFHPHQKKCVFCMSSASVQKAFVFHANKAYQSRGAIYHYRDLMRYLLLMSVIWLNYPTVEECQVRSVLGSVVIP